MHWKIGMMAAVAAGLMGGCQPAPAKRVPTYETTPYGHDDHSDITQVRIVAFRELLKDHPPEVLAFLSNGRGEGTAYSSVTRTVAEQLADLHLRLLPASMASPPRLGAGGPVVEANTGEPGFLYTVVIRHWNDADTAVAEGQKYDGAVPVQGFSAVIRRGAARPVGVPTVEVAPAAEWTRWKIEKVEWWTINGKH